MTVGVDPPPVTAKGVCCGCITKVEHATVELAIKRNLSLQWATVAYCEVFKFDTRVEPVK